MPSLLNVITVHSDSTVQCNDTINRRIAHHYALPFESNPFRDFRESNKSVLEIRERFLCGDVLDCGAKRRTLYNTI